MRFSQAMWPWHINIVYYLLLLLLVLFSRDYQLIIFLQSPKQSCNYSALPTRSLLASSCLSQLSKRCLIHWLSELGEDCTRQTSEQSKFPDSRYFLVKLSFDGRKSTLAFESRNKLQLFSCRVSYILKATLWTTRKRLFGQSFRRNIPSVSDVFCSVV